jgi:probable F420-dependent oxidoreductase
MDFGITLKLDMAPGRAVALAQQAEQAGFSYGWVFDSHVLWLEPYPILTQIAMATKTMRLGTCVTNPATRDPSVTGSTLATLNLISGGRMDLGIGRGDSARRVLGKKPTTLADLEQATTIIRDLAEGRGTQYEGTEITLPWAQPHKLPVWLAAYGPKALRLTGKIADGVILQFGDPHLIKWCMQFVREGAIEAGRDPAAIKVMAATAVWVGDDLEQCRAQVRWFPALVSNHVVDLVQRYGADQLPPELTGYIANRAGYNYQHHAEVGSSNAQFVSDEITDKFCIVGPVEAHIAKLRELRAAGVDQFNIYLMSGAEEQCLETYGREILGKI